VRVNYIWRDGPAQAAHLTALRQIGARTKHDRMHMHTRRMQLFEEVRGTLSAIEHGGDMDGVTAPVHPDGERVQHALEAPNFTGSGDVHNRERRGRAHVAVRVER